MVLKSCKLSHRRTNRCKKSNLKRKASLRSLTSSARKKTLQRRSRPILRWNLLNSESKRRKRNRSALAARHQAHSTRSHLSAIHSTQVAKQAAAKSVILALHDTAMHSHHRSQQRVPSLWSAHRGQSMLVSTWEKKINLRAPRQIAAIRVAAMINHHLARRR